VEAEKTAPEIAREVVALIEGALDYSGFKTPVVSEISPSISPTI
jgi:hypothetical protein